MREGSVCCQAIDIYWPLQQLSWHMVNLNVLHIIYILQCRIEQYFPGTWSVVHSLKVPKLVYYTSMIKFHYTWMFFVSRLAPNSVHQGLASPGWNCWRTCVSFLLCVGPFLLHVCFSFLCGLCVVLKSFAVCLWHRAQLLCQNKWKALRWRDMQQPFQDRWV